MLKAVTTGELDSGLESLTLLLQFHGIAADPGQIRHRFAASQIGITEMLQCARDFKLKARTLATDWPRLARLPLPAIAEQRDGSFVIVAKMTSEKTLVQPPRGAAALLNRAEFE